MKYDEWVILGFLGILFVPSIIGLTYAGVSAVRGMTNWEKGDWENLVAGILGVALVVLLLIGFALLLAELFGSVDCPTAELYDMGACEGDPPDANAILHITLAHPQSL